MRRKITLDEWKRGKLFDRPDGACRMGLDSLVCMKDDEKRIAMAKKCGYVVTRELRFAVTLAYKEDSV